MALPRRSSQSRSPQTFRDHLANIPLPAFRMPAIGTTVAAVLLSVLIWQKSCNSEEDIRPYLPDRMRKEISDEELKLYSRTAHEMVEK
ncbi:MAG: hypothetical protein Q8O99_05200 [bacterium]|nr:hypothetical protein [bacterium]